MGKYICINKYNNYIRINTMFIESFILLPNNITVFKLVLQLLFILHNI